MNATVPLVILGFGAATGIAFLAEMAPQRPPAPSTEIAEVRRSSSRQDPGRPVRANPGGEKECSHCGGEGAAGTVPASANYSLATCVVSGETLGKMGPPVAVVHRCVEVHLCCAGCIKEFQSAPDRYAALVSRAKAGVTDGGTR